MGSKTDIFQEYDRLTKLVDDVSWLMFLSNHQLMDSQDVNTALVRLLNQAGM